MPKTLIAWLGGTAVVLFLLGVALGSSGKTDGDPDTGQQIANIVMPLGVLLALAVIVILVVSAIRLSRKRP